MTTNCTPEASTVTEDQAQLEFHKNEAEKYERQCAYGYETARASATHHRREAAKYAERIKAASAETTKQD